MILLITQSKPQTTMLFIFNPQEKHIAKATIKSMPQIGVDIDLSRSGYFYVARSQWNGKCKLGSTTDLDLTFKELNFNQSTHQTKIIAWQAYADCDRIKATAHELYKDKQFHDDWFDISVDEQHQVLHKAEGQTLRELKKELGAHLISYIASSKIFVSEKSDEDYNYLLASNLIKQIIGNLTKELYILCDRGYTEEMLRSRYAQLFDDNNSAFYCKYPDLTSLHQNLISHHTTINNVNKLIFYFFTELVLNQSGFLTSDYRSNLLKTNRDIINSLASASPGWVESVIKVQDHRDDIKCNLNRLESISYEILYYIDLVFKYDFDFTKPWIKEDTRFFFDIIIDKSDPGNNMGNIGGFYKTYKELMNYHIQKDIDNILKECLDTAQGKTS